MSILNWHTDGVFFRKFVKATIISVAICLLLATAAYEAIRPFGAIDHATRSVLVAVPTEINIKPKDDIVIQADQFREMIEEVLSTAPRRHMDSKAAVELLMLTAATESHMGTYVKQIKGPALGVFQMEPATESDIYEHYLQYGRNRDLLEWVNSFKGLSALPDLKFNLAYQIAMARIHYLRSPMRMPQHDAVEELGRKWKVAYNTSLGKGSREKAVSDYMKYAL